MSQHSNLSLFALCVSLIDLIKIWCSRSRQDLNLLKERLRVRHLPSERGTLPADSGVASVTVTVTVNISLQLILKPVCRLEKWLTALSLYIPKWRWAPTPPPHPPLFFPFISQAYKDSFLWSCITRLLYSHTLVIWHDQDGNRGRGQGFARASPGLEVNLLCWAQNKFDKINTNIEIKATQKMSKSKWRNIIFFYLTFKMKNTNQEPHHCRIDAECSVYCGCSSSGLGLLQLKSGRVLAYLITPNNT